MDARDSDLWSFDYGASESLDGPQSPAKDESVRQNHRTHSTGATRSQKNEYSSSPPPDYRTSVRDAAIPVGMVPSYYDVGGLYRETHLTAPLSPIEHVSVQFAPDDDCAPVSGVTRDATIKSAGFKEILKGWNDHRSKQGLLGRMFRKDTISGGRRKSLNRQSPRVQQQQQQQTAVDSAFISELSAEPEVDAPRTTELDMKVTSAPRGTKTEEDTESLSATQHSIRQEDQTESNKRPVPTLATQMMCERNLAMPGGVQWDPTSSPLRRRTTRLEDVPEHAMQEIEGETAPKTRLQVNNSTFRYYRKYATLAATAGVDTLSRLVTNSYALLPIEPSVPQGYTRVRWTCKCGSHLYDDFIELVPGAAERLERALNAPSPTSTLTPSRPQKAMHSATRYRSHGSDYSGPSRSSSQGASSIFSTASSQSSATSTGGDIGEQPLLRNDSQTSQKPHPEAHVVPLGSNAEPPWLLTCCTESKLTPKITHISMDSTTVRSDKDVALALRAHYSSVHSSLPSSIFRLRGLKSIDFIKFELHSNRLADIRAKPHMPPFPHPSALPNFDPETANWAQSTDYAFEPGHLVPPVGPTYLLHLFAHPHDYETERVTLSRIPKKLGGRLDAGQSGWGIELVEGFMAARVWGMMVLVVLAASVAFAVAWAIGKGDVQGAFAVAGWVVGIAGVLGGWVGAVVE